MSERAICFGGFVKIPCSRSSAWLWRVTAPDHFFFFLAIMGLSRRLRVEFDLDPAALPLVKCLESLNGAGDWNFLCPHFQRIDGAVRHQLEKVRDVLAVWTIAHAQRQIFVHRLANRKILDLFPGREFPAR